MNPLSNPSLFYLIALLLFIGGGYVISQRDRLGVALQQGLIWLLIFLGAIAAYGLRDVITGQLFTSQPAQIGANSYELLRARDGHFHARISINDVPVTLVVDTGATQVVLTKSDARRVGLNPDTLNYNARSQTANGLVASAPVHLETVAFGDVTFRNIPASVNGGALFQSLLGLSVLDRFSRIEIKGDRLLLTP